MRNITSSSKFNYETKEKNSHSQTPALLGFPVTFATWHACYRLVISRYSGCLTSPCLSIHISLALMSLVRWMGATGEAGQRCKCCRKR